MRLALALLAALAAPARAADAYKDLKPLLGDWAGVCNCREGPSEQKIRFSRVKEGVLFNVVSGPGGAAGVLVAQGGTGRYRTVARVTGVPLLTQMGLADVPGSLSVSEDDESEQPDVLSFSAGLSQGIKFLGGGRLKQGGRAISYQITVESPLGKNVCAGQLRKAKPGKKAEPTQPALPSAEYEAPKARR